MKRQQDPPYDAAPLQQNTGGSKPAIADEPATLLPRTQRLIWFMALACGLSCANLVYAQPLLAKMGRGFTVPASIIGLATTSSLSGYILGLILIVPLGEKYSQRRLIILLFCAGALALAMMASAPSAILLIVASGCVGFTSVAPELLIPFAAGMVSAEQRGRIVGMMISGFLIGTPLANSLSGFVGEHMGWRAMYWLAMAFMIILGILSLFLLPHDTAAKQLVRYSRLLGSLWQLFCAEPVLREVSLLGLLVYGAFNIFWVALSFILAAAPLHYGSTVAGLVGLVGLAGALAAFSVGRITNQKNLRRINGIALLLTLLAFVLMWLTGRWLIGLIVGALLLDLGTQSNQVVNETRLYELPQASWNRLNALYILMFSIGGALGSALGSSAWNIARWNGVYGGGCCLLVIALGYHLLHNKRIRRGKRPPRLQV